MDQDIVIDVQNITKSFKVYKDRSNTLKEYAIYSKRRKFEVNDVIKGISFQVRRGEAVGLIGRNGCGKSTTLKMLTRIMYPDTGSIDIKGRVSSLIELGAGFHPDMSGRENIYINASIFGLTKKEIDASIDDIVDFSELGEYIDNPVRTYSSGMYMRLAFSVAINVKAEVLLIDEILAVGDTNFQTKCFKKLREIKKEGTTIVIVSHSLGQIEAFCDKTIWIEEGRIKKEGEPRLVHRDYLQYMGKERQSGVQNNDSSNNQRHEGNQKVVFKRISMLDASRNECHQFNRGSDILVEVEYHVNSPIDKCYFSVDVIREDDGMYCFASNTLFDYERFIRVDHDSRIVLRLKNIQLAQQRYYIDFMLKEDTNEIVDVYREAVPFEIFTDIKYGGISFIEHSWKDEVNIN